MNPNQNSAITQMKMQEKEEPNTDDQTSTKSSSNVEFIKNILVLFILPSFIIYVINSNDFQDALLGSLENNRTEGLFISIGVCFVATVLYIPGTILAVGAGYTFSSAFGLGDGVLLASISVSIGASTGALISFKLGRNLLRDWVVTCLTNKYKLFEAIDTALTNNGFKIMSLLRLAPIIPFNSLNYVAGVTSVSFRDNALALLFILPGIVAFVFLGSSVGSLCHGKYIGDDLTTTILTVVFGTLFGFLGVAATSNYAKKELLAAVIVKEEDIRANDESLSRDVEMALVTY